MHKFYDVHRACELADKEITIYRTKKINIIDESERLQTLEFIKGFKTGRNNTIANIVHAHQSGQSLKSIYKAIKEIYRKEIKDANINNGC